MTHRRHGHISVRRVGDMPVQWSTLHCRTVWGRSECVTAVTPRPGKSRSLPISPRSARRPSVTDPACPARPANVRCVDVRTKPSEMRSPAGGPTVGDWAKAAIPRVIERGLKPCVDQGRASPDHGNRPGVGGPSGTKAYSETRENLHDDRHGAHAASACRRAPRLHANRPAGRSLGRGRVSVLLAFASPAVAHKHPKDNLDAHFLDTLERPDNAANPARNMAGTFNSRLCCTDQDAVKVDYEMVVPDGGKYPEPEWYVD
jgi:hypothetical protein